MAYILVHHTVDDYKRWKPLFDKHSSVRERSGSRGGKVFSSTDNPNDLFILLEWDGAENAQKFAQSDNLKEVMQEAGVVSIPEVYFLDEVARTSF